MAAKTNTEIICAPATLHGGALGIIRISGQGSIAAVKDVCKGLPEKTEARKAYFCRLYEREELLDEVIVTTYEEPNSYTGEDCVEISCHGSVFIMQHILSVLTENGLRIAQPGEFTQRAFLNGKMDLSQAEAVADLINASSKAAHHAAISQLRGHFSSRLTQLRDKLLKLTSLLELELDFSDHEDLQFADRKELVSLVDEIDNHVSELTDSFKTGEAIRKGIPVAIVGETNVGKSTLLNRLVREERAIVSDIHGTTRDTIEETIELGGISFRFIDTAGLRDTEDYIEQMGIKRTYEAVKRASIIIWLTDERPSNRQIEEMTELTEGKELIVVQNKSDLLSQGKADQWICPMLFISAKNGTGIEALEKRIRSAANIPEISTNDIIVTSPRHIAALTQAKSSLQSVRNALIEQRSADIVAEDLRQVLSHLAEITEGQISPQETLNNIFSHFCVGK